MLSRPTELRHFLHSLGMRPKKGLSQHFLIDGNIIQKILATAKVTEGDRILEIGPGPGAITEALLQKNTTITAIEKDPIYAEALKRLEGIDIYNRDILDFSFDALEGKMKVVSNLPFHLTAPILARLVPRCDLFSTLTVVVQEEVARRMTALPQTKEYSSLTVFLNFYSKPCYAFKVSRNCFYPQPKVDSAVVTLELHEPPSVDEESFFAFVRKAFNQRRKMVKTTLGIVPQQNPQARPEELSLSEFLELFLHSRSSAR